jgi:arylsulfatase A-like enzyme
LILVDNCGKEWFGCYGSKELATPAIDRLAAEGALFQTCYTVPICGPSRAMLLTGRYPHRTGWTIHHDAALYRGGGLDPTRELTVARPLLAAGYRTAVVGKWQIDNLYDHPSVLREHGFERWCVWPGSIDRERMNPIEFQDFMQAVETRNSEQVLALNRGIESRYWDPVLNIDGKVQRFSGAFGPDRCQDFARQFIQTHVDHPFFLYYPMVLTHGISMKQPVVGVPPHRQPLGTDIEGYREMVRYVDKQVAELVEHLESLQIRRKTLLILATDNGSESLFHAGFRGHTLAGGLYTTRESGINVPLIFHWPGTIAAGLRGRLSDFTDLFPTICDFAGVPLPKGTIIDGHSHRPFLVGEAEAQPGKPFALTQHHRDRVARFGNFKLHSDGRFYRIEDELIEFPLNPEQLTPAAAAAYRDLSDYLQQLPEDAVLPFERRSITAFQWGVK